MKFLEILLTFLSTQGKAFLQSNTEALTQSIVNNARKVATLLCGLVISLSLFCIGFSVAFSGVIAYFSHNNEGFLVGSQGFFSPAVIGGSSLTLAALVALSQCLSERHWLKATGLAPTVTATPSPITQGPGLDTAIAVLILEIASELKERRSHATPPSPANAQT